MKIVWTKFSETSLLEIVNYIENDFGNLTAEKYYSKVIETVDNIEIRPKIFPVFQSSTETRKAVINKKTILYYKIIEENIMLLAFYDVRIGTHKL
jgi:plasmid stabilization system protein ParE